MASSTATLTEALRQTPLLSDAQRQELVRDLQPRCTDVRSLARALIARGWLTTYQINQLSQGRGAELVLGPYVLLERLGEGGTGQVFKARHVHMNRIVALKLIRAECLTDREVVGRFQREVQLISTLTHPHVVHAYDAGPVGPNYFLVMEYVEGIDLARLVRKQGALSVPQSCEYIRQAALGLQHIHERNLIHRDIKPSNLFITGLGQPGVPRPPGDPVGDSPWGVLKILDLGLARLQRPVNGEVTGDLTNTNNMTLGTLDYMAPEQAIDFHRADIRADIYSLGCSFYQLLTGQPPFPGGTMAQKLLRHQQAEPPPMERFRPDVPAPVVSVLKRMMAKKVGERYQTPGDVARLLNALAPGDAEVVYLPAVPVAGNPGNYPLAIPVPTQGGMSTVRTGLTQRFIRNVPQLARRRPRLVLAGAAAALALLFLMLPIAYFAFRGKSTAVAKSTEGTETSAPQKPAEKEAPPAPPQAFLSDLPEASTTGVVFAKNGLLGHNGNGNLAGNPKEARIIVKGVLARKGLSTLAPSGGAATVSYKLGKQYKKLTGGVALHDRGWFSGSKVTFVVLGDGKVLWRSKEIATHDDYPQSMEVDVTGIDQMELQVTVTSSNNGVWPVWIDPRVTK
jgi:serine/threonine-protein kinase